MKYRIVMVTEKRRDQSHDRTYDTVYYMVETSNFGLRWKAVQNGTPYEYRWIDSSYAKKYIEDVIRVNRTISVRREVIEWYTG